MINMNLLPSEVKQKIKKSRQAANIFSICLVVVFVILIIGFLLSALKKDYLLPQLDSVNENIKKADTDLKTFGKSEEQALFLNDRAKLAIDIEKNQVNWYQTILDLSNSVPANVQFNNLVADVSKTPNFVLQGTTDSERDAIKFKEKLENSGNFKDVAFKSSSTSKSADPNAPSRLDFTLEFNLEKVSTEDSATKETK